MEENKAAKGHRESWGMSRLVGKGWGSVTVLYRVIGGLTVKMTLEQ